MQTDQSRTKWLRSDLSKRKRERGPETKYCFLFKTLMKNIMDLSLKCMKEGFEWLKQVSSFKSRDWSLLFLGVCKNNGLGSFSRLVPANKWALMLLVSGCLQRKRGLCLL